MARIARCVSGPVSLFFDNVIRNFVGALPFAYAEFLAACGAFPLLSHKVLSKRGGRSPLPVTGYKNGLIYCYLSAIGAPVVILIRHTQTDRTSTHASFRDESPSRLGSGIRRFGLSSHPARRSHRAWCLR